MTQASWTIDATAEELRAALEDLIYEFQYHDINRKPSRALKRARAILAKAALR